MSCARCKQKEVVNFECLNCGNKQWLYIREGADKLAVAKRKHLTCRNCRGVNFKVL